MMRTVLSLTAAAVVTAGLFGTATAQPVSVADEAETGSSAVDAGSAAARSAVYFAQNGDLIGFIVLLGVTPFQILTSGICDLATMSSLPNPCRGTTRYTVAAAP
ncbi:hypothetical protein [Nocardia asteroides]|uniref:hypothetical protein n=1 Tax=Nocardia asteroides TaxID=1824 RepID=UPI0033E94EC1